MNTPNTASNPVQQKLFAMLQDMKQLNTKILEQLPNCRSNHEEFTALVSKRDEMSQSITDLCTSQQYQADLEILAEEVELEAQTVLKLDEQLLTRIEKEMEKLKGLQSRAAFQARLKN